MLPISKSKGCDQLCKSGQGHVMKPHERLECLIHKDDSFNERETKYKNLNYFNPIVLKGSHLGFFVQT
jgi:hypothetical protein